MNALQLALALGAATAVLPIGSAGPLNVLFIVSDDLRPEMGCYGGQAVTPHLDKFAASPGAVLFERSYVQQAICCPTRSSFLTGRRPDTTKVWDLHTHFRASAGRTWTTLPEYFKDHGYFTAGMGKVFHPVKDPATGQANDIGYSWTAPYFSGTGIGGSMEMCWNERGNGTTDEQMADGSIAAHGVSLLQNASKFPDIPFFIAVGIHRPHLPWDVPAHWYSLYPAAEDISLADHRNPPAEYGSARNYSWDPQSGPRHCGPLKELSDPEDPKMGEFALVPDDVARNFRRGYYAAVSATDHNAGLVLNALTNLKLEEKTITIFLGDHGWQLGDLGEFGKKTNFEAATRTPLIIRVPPSLLGLDSAAAGNTIVRTNALVEFVDIMPTLIESAGLPMPDLCPMDSRGVKLCREGDSLLPVMKNPERSSDWKAAAFMQYPTCMHDEGIWHDACKRSGPQFAGTGQRDPLVMGYAIRTRRYRYVEWVPFNQSTTPPTAHWDGLLGTELYDFTTGDNISNVHESINLAARPAQKSVVEALRVQLRAGWRKSRPLF